MSDKMMRIAGRGEDGLAKAVSADNTGRINVNSEIKRKSLPVIFNDVYTANIVDETEIITSVISLDKISEFEIFVQCAGVTSISVRVIPMLSGQGKNLNFYDWNTDTWRAHSNVGTPSGIILPPKNDTNHVYSLSTHPDLYWLRGLKATTFMLGFKAVSPPSSPTEVRVWVGGI